MSETNGLNKDKIKVVFMDPPAKPAALMEKKVDALLGGASDQYWLIKYKGFKPTRLKYADIGVDTIGMTIHAHTDTLKDKPDLVRRFVKATIRSWEAARQDPAAAAKAALKVKPDLNAVLHRGPAADEPEPAVLEEFTGQVHRLIPPPGLGAHDEPAQEVSRSADGQAGDLLLHERLHAQVAG